MKESRILGIRIWDRVKEAGRTQEILSRYGHIIKTRFGFHELSEDTCSRTGVIILELAGNSQDWDKLEEELNAIYGLEIKNMTFQF